MTEARAKLGVNKDPTSMTEHQRVELAKLATRVARETKQYDLLIKSNEQIRLKVNEHRLILINTKGAVLAMGKHIERIRADMKVLLPSAAWPGVKVPPDDEDEEAASAAASCCMSAPALDLKSRAACSRSAGLTLVKSSTLTDGSLWIA